MNVSITPWQRRGAAEALRSLGRTTLPVVAIVDTVADAYGGRPDASPVESLADLVDWPTCSMDKTESLKTEGGETVNVWECSNCGQECEEINGSYEFCPHCGAEVADDE